MGKNVFDFFVDTEITTNRFVDIFSGNNIHKLHSAYLNDSVKKTYLEDCLYTVETIGRESKGVTHSTYPKKPPLESYQQTGTLE